MVNNEYPREIEVGGGPNVIAHTQGEYDAFIAAAQANSRILLRERQESEGWPYVVGLYNTAKERPDAPYSLCGPFPTADEARAFAAEWTQRCAHPEIEARAGRLPSPEYFAEWMRSGDWDLVEDGDNGHE